VSKSMPHRAADQRGFHCGPKMSAGFQSTPAASTNAEKPSMVPITPASCRVKTSVFSDSVNTSGFLEKRARWLALSLSGNGLVGDGVLRAPRRPVGSHRSLLQAEHRAAVNRCPPGPRINPIIPLHAGPIRPTTRVAVGRPVELGADP